VALSSTQEDLITNASVSDRLRPPHNIEQRRPDSADADEGEASCRWTVIWHRTDRLPSKDRTHICRIGILRQPGQHRPERCGCLWIFARLRQGPWQLWGDGIPLHGRLDGSVCGARKLTGWIETAQIADLRWGLSALAVPAMQDGNA